MTKAQLTEKIRDLILECKGTDLAMVTIIAVEGEIGVRIMHNLITDNNAGKLMEAIAPTLKGGDA